MNQARGRGGNPGRNNPGGNAWGNQGRGRGQKNENQPNFADSDAFGPPLGRGKAKQNKNPATSVAPVPTTRADQPLAPKQSAPQQAQGRGGNESAQPGPSSAWGQPKKIEVPTSTGPKKNDKVQSTIRPKGNSDAPSSTSSKRNDDIQIPGTSQSDGQNRGEAVRGAIHGNRPERSVELVKTRPDHVVTKKGTTGRNFLVKANYFQLKSSFKWEIFHYRVEFAPEVENVAFRNRLLADQRARLGGFLYDRGESIFTAKQLESEKIEISTRDRDDKEILIKITRVGIISPLENRSIQVLNVIVKKSLKELELQRVGRDYFDPGAKIEIRAHNIELWPGYTTSIRQHEKSLLMMAEIKHKLMRTESLLGLLRRCHNENRNNWQQAFMQQVLGMVVLTGYNNKTYRISDVVFDLSPSSTFETRDGPISYIEYYRTKHNQIITDKSQPLLRSKPTEKDIRGARGRDEEAQPINLVPELCLPTGYTDDMRKNFNLMKDVAEFTRVGPHQRIAKLLAFNQRMQTNQKSIACYRDWGLNLDSELVDVPARELEVEKIILGNKMEVKTDRAAWTNALQGRNSMHTSIKLGEQWAAVIPQNLQRDADAFIRCIIEVSKGMNFDVGQPRIISIRDDRTTTLSNELENVCNQNLRLILIAVSNNQSDRYSAIKKVCSVRHAVPSQVVTRRVMDARDMRRMRSVATKVAIQINSKIGGMPWSIDVKLNNIMFIGYDVCHDTRDKSRSYGAVVATMDMRQSTKFFSAVSAHVNGEELSNNLSLNIMKAIKQYQQTHNTLPDRILFYRDGVGEGQTEYVYQHELQHLLDTLKAYYKEKPLKLAFVIVSKRINTKFFDNRGNSFTNVPPGTVVDDIVTLPERYDFFLVSQAVTQGSATPTNYNVIYDTFGLPPDKLQIMTYKMCHLYYNWSGTTRVPAVCQYAHKLAFLVGNFLHSSPSLALSPYLYFL